MIACRNTTGHVRVRSMGLRLANDDREGAIVRCALCLSQFRASTMVLVHGVVSFPRVSSGLTMWKHDEG